VTNQPDYIVAVQDMRYLASACLTPDQAVALREERATGNFSLRQLEAKWGLCASAICKITRGHSYRHVGGPITTGRVKR
jgi:hypothetical protein